VIAFVRGVSDGFCHALSAAGHALDAVRARTQHAAYCDALAAAGCELVRVPGDPALPDCCFVEDTAVVAGDRVVITRPGAPSRRGEVDAVAAAIAQRLPARQLARVDAPATLDGGDCMRLARRIYVGRTARTNAAGVRALAAACPDWAVVAVELPPEVLHLKCVCSPLGEERVLLARGTISPDVFRGADIVWAPAEESYAANAVAIGDTVLAARGFPQTHEALATAGMRVVPIDTSELRKADGSLTCLSILVDG
jgi:dimethylargininase